MTESLRLLLEHSLDFAGLFPPAAQPMTLAAPAFAADRVGGDGWMLARFVCPAAKLNELAAVLTVEAGPAGPLAVSALGRNGKTTGEFLAGLDADLSAITAFRNRVAERAGLGVVEVRLPGDAIAPAVLKKLLGTIEALLARVPNNGLQPFFELAFSPSLPAQLGVLAEHNAATPARQERPAGFKLRTGGTDPATFPTAEQFADVLVAARDATLPMKCTGGLHHALPHRSASLGVRMHGFVNVLVAAALAHHTRADAGTLRAVLEEEQAAAFTFDATGLTWREHRLDLAALRAARLRFFTAFGCCYLDRPRAGLRAAGWLQ